MAKYTPYQHDEDETRSPSPSPPRNGSPPKTPSPPSPAYTEAYGDSPPNENGNGNANGFHGKNDLPPPLYTSRPSTGTRSSARRSQPTALLGSIDEHSSNMAPDIPLRNGKRNSPPAGTTRAFFTSWFPHDAKVRSLPEDEYDGLTGPKGEKLGDARRNWRGDMAGERRDGGGGLIGMMRRGGWRTWACLVMIVVMIAAVVAIGLVVGLKKMNKHHKSSDTSSNSTTPSNSPPALTGFPIGAYAIPTYLLTLASSCTPSPSTWRCYPYQLYTPSSPLTSSLATANWIISGVNSSSDDGYYYTVMSVNNPFSWTFGAVNLTLVDARTDDEAYSFTVQDMTKVVVPDSVITSDGHAAQCNYVSSLTAKLYTKKPRTIGEVGDGEWPYAIEVMQTSKAAPQCYETTNGELGAQVALTGTAVGEECVCGYQNFGGG